MMILTTLLLICILSILIFLVEHAECAGNGIVDVTMLEYKNHTTLCTDLGTGLDGCDFQFTMTFKPQHADLTYRLNKTKSFPADSNFAVYFGIGNNGLGNGISNPITIAMLVNENIALTVKVMDDDYPFSDDHIATFTTLFPTTTSTPSTPHNVTYTAYGGTLKMSFMMYCSGNFDGVGCSQCLPGWYTDDCNVNCTSFGNFTCDPQTGDQVCTTDHYGANCDVLCAESPRYNCTDAGTKTCKGNWTGSDCEGCKAEHYGENCTRHCAETTRYNCSSTGLKTCKGHWEGADCDTCEAGYHGAQCAVFCVNSTTYTCSNNGAKVCRARWTGANCSQSLCNNTSSYTCNSDGTKQCLGQWTGEQCDRCKDTWYGANCTVSCVNSTSYTCAADGGKICTATWTGVDCDSCAAGWYGANCDLYCVNTTHYTCSGTGARQCLGGWTGPLCDSCTSGYYGINCTRFCSAIPGKYSCDSNGTKVCVGNWNGTNCDECKEDYYGPSCDQHCTAIAGRSVCNEKGDLVCLARFTGTNCSSCSGNRTGDDCAECKQGYFGANCSRFCQKTQQYDCSSDGEKRCLGNWDGDDCTDCKPDYFGSECSKYCVPELPKYNCSSSGDIICLGNRTGENCGECKDNYYSINCTVYCKSKEGVYKCSENGQKECVGNWSGEECEKCKRGFYGNDCQLQSSQTDKSSSQKGLENNMSSLSKAIVIIVGTCGIVLGLSTIAAIYGIVTVRKYNQQIDWNRWSRTKVRPVPAHKVHVAPAPAPRCHSDRSVSEKGCHSEVTTLSRSVSAASCSTNVSVRSINDIEPEVGPIGGVWYKNNAFKDLESGMNKYT